MENQTTENTASLDSAETVKVNTPQKTFLQRTSKWTLLSVPVVAIALLGYGYNTGYLQQASSKASAFIATYVPGAAKATAAGTSESLSVARAAFASGDMDAAIAGYRAHIAGNPADMSAHGELGNVLYTVGALPEAAQVYFETANMALEQNQPEVAEALLPAVSEGNPMLANQLHDKLFDAQMRADMSHPIEGEPQQAGKQQG